MLATPGGFGAHARGADASELETIYELGQAAADDAARRRLPRPRARPHAVVRSPQRAADRAGQAGSIRLEEPGPGRGVGWTRYGAPTHRRPDARHRPGPVSSRRCGSWPDHRRSAAARRARAW